MALTRKQIRQRMGVELRGFRNSTATAGSTAHTLVDTAYPYRTNRQDGAYTDFAGWWMFRPSAAAVGDQQRRVLTYDPPTGTFLPDEGYTNSPSGEVYELWDETIGLTLDELHDAINQSLRRVFVTDRFWLVPPTDSQVGSFHRLGLPADTRNWLTNPRWVQSVGTLSEPARVPASMDASILSAKDYAGALLTFKRDRTQGALRRVQVASAATTDDTQATLAVTLAQTPTIGNLLVLVVSGYGGTDIIYPNGWTAGPTAIKNNVLLGTFYRFVPQTVSPTISIEILGASASASSITVAEYSGVLPGGIDVTSSTTGNSATLASGTTTAPIQGDELWIAALAANYAAAQFNPTNRFSLVANPYNPAFSDFSAYHAVYERVMPETDLQERTPSMVDGGAWDPAVLEGDTVYLTPSVGVASPNAYVVQARRPLYSYCRYDSTGQFGSKTDGLTGESQQTEGGVENELLDTIVAGAISSAYENYATFRDLAEGERLQRILRARAKFEAFARAAVVKGRSRFRYKEVVG